MLTKEQVAAVVMYRLVQAQELINKARRQYIHIPKRHAARYDAVQEELEELVHLAAKDAGDD